MAQSYDLGLEGEAIACRELERDGCRIIETRWKLNHLELDIIATDGTSLIVAEVKTRRTSLWGDPSEFVTPRKMHSMVLATDAYIKMHRIDLPYRFDIFGILIEKSGKVTIEHIKDAFYPALG